MNARRHTKFVREGAYAAEVDVELIEEDNGWSHPDWPVCLALRLSGVERPGEQAHSAAAAAPRR